MRLFRHPSSGFRMGVASLHFESKQVVERSPNEGIVICGGVDEHRGCDWQGPIFGGEKIDESPHNLGVVLQNRGEAHSSAPLSQTDAKGTCPQSGAVEVARPNESA
jgi:hypothetical protein